MTDPMTDPVADSVTDDQAWVDWLCRNNNYTAGRVLPDGVRYAAVMPLMFTAAIITGEIGDTSCYLDRWCYRAPLYARLALEVWDGAGEPVGWHRHPASGRRRAGPDGDIDEDGQRVEPGVIYRRC